MTVGLYAPVKKALGEFYSTTQINGISNASRATHPFRKSVWWVITLIAAGATAYGIYDVIATYLKFSVSTTVSVTQPEFLEFPAVTVCNLSPFPCSKVAALNNIEDLSKEGGRKEFADDQVTSNTYMYLLSSLTKEQKLQLVQDRDEFIRSCTYEGIDCKSFFLPFSNTTYGSCYVFNLKLNMDNDSDAGSRKVVFAGPSNGLQLELYLNASQWPSSVLSSEGGVRVVINQPSNLPSPEESGFDARTGSVTKMCRRMCLQAKIVKNCFCKLPYIQDYFTFSDGELDDSPICDVRSLDAMTSMTLGTQMQSHGRDRMKSEVVKVVIYFSSIIKETIAESPSVTSTDLLSSLGGALSLYLGISLVMFLEIIEIIPLAVLAFISKCFGIDQEQNNPPPRRRVPCRSAAPLENPAPNAWNTKPF
ncbi:unnamed protein product [Darwinula stevensoni]|uniref:Uncharacterized protein n=1 Tax=Darwinula stevensoni TaxID=69355 RepID=A0A7R9A570_9CRUS|nr:unnamed protein product [Darwinula stevensoni]CAG0893797.1 unnamed protein product [Darwinula stevensoni]